MKEYRFYFKYDYGKGNTEERTEDVIITNVTNPDKYGRQRAKDIVYGKKRQWKLYGNEYKRKFFDCVFLRSVFLRNIEKNEGDKMDFDYYQIKGKWNAATLNRRAEKLDEAQAAADELEAAGAKSVEIIGVKAGRRETIRGKKNVAAKKTAVKMTGTTGEYITDYKTHEKAAAAAKNIERQLDLFSNNEDENKTKILKFSDSELGTIINDYYDLISSGERLTNYKNTLTTFEKAHPREKIEFTKKEIKQIIGVLQKYMKKHNTDKDKSASSFYGHTKELRDFFIKAYYNV